MRVFLPADAFVVAVLGAFDSLEDDGNAFFVGETGLDEGFSSIMFDTHCSKSGC
jgi:hypothetical protein